MNRSFVVIALVSLALRTAAFAGSDNNPAAEPAAEISVPYRFSAEFDVEGAYVGDSDVRRGGRDVNDFDELYSNVRFVYTPRVKFGILRLGAQQERYSFGFSGSGQQLPNTLQAINSIVGLDTQFSDSILVRLEAQPGFYGTTFDRLATNQFNVPFVLGGTYIYSPELQFVLGVGVNLEQRYPVLPGGGLRWKIAPQWVLNAVLPTPRLEYQATRSITLFAGADIKANTFRVDHRFGDSHGDTSLNSAWLSYEEVRTGVGAEIKLNSSLTLTLEGGYLPYRDFDFHRTDVRYHSESGAPYGSLVLHGAF